MQTRTQRRMGTKSTSIPGSAGPTGIYQKLKLGRYGRPSKIRYTKSNEAEWRHK